MNINIEMFDKEPIENIITCLHFKMDKVIFFGQDDVMTDEAKAITKKALIEKCKVSDVSFVELSMKSIDRVLSVLTDTVMREEKNGGRCFLDLTGGGEMVLVAMGMYAATHKIPMHRYDVARDELILLNAKDISIEAFAEKRDVPLSIDDLIWLQGGAVDYAMQKESKENLELDNFQRDAEAIWQIAKGNMRRWNAFSAVLKACKSTVESMLEEALDIEKVTAQVDKNSAFSEGKKFTDYLTALETAKVIENLVTDSTHIRFRYKNSRIRGCLLEAGSVLELHTYFERKDSGLYADCRIGIHLKWGMNSSDGGAIVNNEIDVLALRGYCLTFVSCKGGAVDQMALYELDTVAERFGGKYAKKELVTAGFLDRHHEKRAEEMDISVTKV